ncbi:MAG: hypothetical protein AAF551_04875 [Bacteroidota bacterium]
MGRLLLLLSICCTSTLLAQTSNTIYVDNGKIRSSCGEEIVMRGYNEMFIWSGD